MLRVLAQYTSLTAPAVVAAGPDRLVFEHVAGDTAHTPTVERDAADHLTALHDHTAGAFGFPFDTLSGPLSQPNPWTASWVEFFAEHRLGHVTALAREAGRLDPETGRRLDRVVASLDALLDEPTRPALVHGDVWTENVLSERGAVTAVLAPRVTTATRRSNSHTSRGPGRSVTRSSTDTVSGVRSRPVSKSDGQCTNSSRWSNTSTASADAIGRDSTTR